MDPALNRELERIETRTSETVSGKAQWEKRGSGNFSGSHCEYDSDRLVQTCVYILQRYSNGNLFFSDSETSPGSAPQTVTATSATHRAQLQTLITEVERQVSGPNLRGTPTRERLPLPQQRDRAVDRDRGGLHR